MYVRMRRPATWRVTRNPDVAKLMQQERLAGLPEVQPTLTAAIRRRMVRAMAAELKAGKIAMLRASVFPSRRRR
jgi:hypothetical protein